VAVVLFPSHLPHVLHPVDLAWVRRFKAFLSAEFHRMSRDHRLPANAFAEMEENMAKAFAEMEENMATAAQKHRTRVAIVYWILEANQVVMIGSVTGLGFLCCGLAPWTMDHGPWTMDYGPWDVGREPASQVAPPST
jgi:hypothetical protein